MGNNESPLLNSKEDCIEFLNNTLSYEAYETYVPADSNPWYWLQDTPEDVLFIVSCLVCEALEI